jgi:hypothetical protein
MPKAVATANRGATAGPAPCADGSGARPLRNIAPQGEVWVRGPVPIAAVVPVELGLSHE